MIAYKGFGRDDSETQTQVMPNWATCIATQNNWAGSSGDCPQDCKPGSLACVSDQCIFNGFVCPCARAQCAPQNLRNEDRYLFPGATFLLPNAYCDQGYPGHPWATALAASKIYRTAVLADYQVSAGVAARVCLDAIASCASGVTSCDLRGCVPQALQWSCMEPMFFANGPTRVIYIFGSSKVRRHPGSGSSSASWWVKHSHFDLLS